LKDCAASQRRKTSELQASRDLLASIKVRLAELDRFWEKEQTKADVEVFILDEVFAKLPHHTFHHRREEGRCRQRVCPRLAAGHERRTRDGGLKTVFRLIIGYYSGAQTPTASRRNAARHRLLTAAPVSLERLYLCCKGSCKFVESSLALSCCGNLHRRSIFDPGKNRNRPP